MTTAVILLLGAHVAAAGECRNDMDCPLYQECSAGTCVEQSDIGSELPPPVPHESRTPPLNGGRLLGELVLGGLFAGAAAILPMSIVVAQALGCGYGGHCQDSAMAGIFALSIPFVYALGAAAGVYTIGAIGNETGSFGSTYGGGLLGVLGSVLLFVLAADTDDDALVIAGLAAPVVGSMIGFNSTRTYEHTVVRLTALPVEHGVGLGLAWEL